MPKSIRVEEVLEKVFLTNYFSNTQVCIVPNELRIITRWEGHNPRAFRVLSIWRELTSRDFYFKCKCLEDDKLYTVTEKEMRKSTPL